MPQLADTDLPPVPVTRSACGAGRAASAAASSPAAAPAAAPKYLYRFRLRHYSEHVARGQTGRGDLVKQLGFGWVKQQVRWEYAEPGRANIQWQGDGWYLVNTAERQRHQHHVQRGDVAAVGASNLGGQAARRRISSFLPTSSAPLPVVTAVAYAEAIEVWNEQNLRREWEGFPLEASSYTELLKRSYNSDQKGACPSVLVISGATTPAGYLMSHSMTSTTCAACTRMV